MSEQRDPDLDRNPNRNADIDPEPYWTKIGRVNDILSVVGFPLALFSGLTGVGLLTYCGMVELPGTGPTSPKLETQPEAVSSSDEAAPSSRKTARIDARITPNKVKTIDMMQPTVAKGTDDDTAEGLEESDQTAPSENDLSKVSAEGWIYAGAYPTQAYYLGPYYKGPCRLGGCTTGWTTRYLNFAEETKPRDLKGKALYPLKHSNVRTNHPSLQGVAAPFGIVAPDTRLVVSDVFLRQRGQEVWLKVKIYGSVLPLNVADLDKSPSDGR